LTYNLGEERSVGLINYELDIRGKSNLESTSQKLVLNKSFDLLEKFGKLSEFCSYRNAAQDIKAMKVKWNEKMKKMEKEGNLKKDIENNHATNIMYRDLEYLKARGGLFTKVEEVVDFDKKAEESKEKNVRLYTEVRYAKNSCLLMKHTASVFRLKHDHKNLSSKEYVENLSQYLGDVRSKKIMTTEDLRDLLLKLNENCTQQNDDVDFAQEDFITKAIKCLTSFINKNYLAKPWNQQKHFDGFISPKVNESLPFIVLIVFSNVVWFFYITLMA